MPGQGNILMLLLHRLVPSGLPLALPGTLSIAGLFFSAKKYSFRGPACNVAGKAAQTDCIYSHTEGNRVFES